MRGSIVSAMGWPSPRHFFRVYHLRTGINGSSSFTWLASNLPRGKAGALFLIEYLVLKSQALSFASITALVSSKRTFSPVLLT